MAKQVSKTYGSALFEVAKEMQALDTILKEVLFVKQTFVENEELNKLLLHPNIEKSEKIQVIENIFKGRISDEITGLMTMLVDKGHVKEFVPVFDYVIHAIKEEKGIGVAYITSAVALNDSQQEKIEQKLLETTDYKSIEGIYQVDEDLIGGLVIRICDKVVDSSLRTQLDKLSKQL